MNDTPIVDINSFEESVGTVEMLVATLPKSSQIVFMGMNGKLHEDQLEKVVDLANSGCKDVYNILDQAVREHVSRMSTAINST